MRSLELEHLDRESPRVRLVDRLVKHGPPIRFGELLEKAVPPETRYLVLDLDRTTHLERNLGELLGWEVCAYLGYGEARLAALEAERKCERFCFDWDHPSALLRYLLLGVRMWAAPGLFYFAWGRLPSRIIGMRRLAYRRFGREPVQEVQRVPQMALFGHLAALPIEKLNKMAKDVWDRFSSDQVIEREDIDAVRQRCKDLRVVISSASPRPTVEVAAEALGADDLICSTVDEHDGFLCAPLAPQKGAAPVRSPRCLSPPSKIRINAGYTKVESLLERYPDMADPGVTTVGITDNGNGEDQAWAEHFSVVVDVNSPRPFSPIVFDGSPLREIHSAAVLTRREREIREHEPEHLDHRRRVPRQGERFETFDRELPERLAGDLKTVTRLARRFAEVAETTRPKVESHLERLEALNEEMEREVASYNNGCSSSTRRKALRALRRCLDEESAARRALAKKELPLSEVAYELSRSLERARARLD